MAHIESKSFVEVGICFMLLSSQWHLSICVVIYFSIASLNLLLSSAFIAWPKYIMSECRLVKQIGSSMPFRNVWSSSCIISTVHQTDSKEAMYSYSVLCLLLHLIGLFRIHCLLSHLSTSTVPCVPYLDALHSFGCYIPPQERSADHYALLLCSWWLPGFGCAVRLSQPFFLIAWLLVIS